MVKNQRTKTVRKRARQHHRMRRVPSRTVYKCSCGKVHSQSEAFRLQGKRHFPGEV